MCRLQLRYLLHVHMPASVGVGLAFTQKCCKDGARCLFAFPIPEPATVPAACAGACRSRIGLCAAVPSGESICKLQLQYLLHMHM